MKLFYFTETYPFGLGLPWKTNELEVLSGKFEKVYIITLYKTNGAVALSRPMTNAIVLDLCFTRPDSEVAKPTYNIRTLRKAIGQFILNGKIYRRSKFLKVLHFRRGASRLLKSASMQFALSATDDQTVWYFF